jgi:hypothetical protein
VIKRKGCSPIWSNRVVPGGEAGGAEQHGIQKRGQALGIFEARTAQRVVFFPNPGRFKREVMGCRLIEAFLESKAICQPKPTQNE